MAPNLELDGLDRVPIAQLNPAIQALAKAVEGVVTLIWPYSVSKQSFSILLAEPDFRLRRHRGQVRIQFTGSSAKVAARCNLQSGDHVLLNLVGAQWERDETMSSTLGRGIEWELHFAERAVLRTSTTQYPPQRLETLPHRYMTRHHKCNILLRRFNSQQSQLYVKHGRRPHS
ncbi:MAG: hypothetical protein Q9179_007159 [Wetmoreana sp. 5 TL-2023]